MVHSMHKCLMAIDHSLDLCPLVIGLLRLLPCHREEPTKLLICRTKTARFVGTRLLHSRGRPTLIDWHSLAITTKYISKYLIVTFIVSFVWCSTCRSALRLPAIQEWQGIGCTSSCAFHSFPSSQAQQERFYKKWNVSRRNSLDMGLFRAQINLELQLLPFTRSHMVCLCFTSGHFYQAGSRRLQVHIRCKECGNLPRSLCT